MSRDDLPSVYSPSTVSPSTVSPPTAAVPAVSPSIAGHRAGRAGRVSTRRFRFLLQGAAVLLLLPGVAGGAQLGDNRDRPVSAAGAAAPAAPDQADELRRFEAVYERADRQRREAEQEEVQRVSRADEAPPSPEPEPEPAPDSDGDPDDDAGDAPAGEPAGPVPAACDDYSGNRATGCTLLLEHGFSLDQMPCLDNLWTKESGWDHTARNPSSGAYGIPQALPGSKMADAGSDWETNPATQIRWGLGYIENRYSTPCGAWQFWQNNNWY